MTGRVRLSSEVWNKISSGWVHTRCISSSQTSIFRSELLTIFARDVRKDQETVEKWQLQSDRWRVISRKESRLTHRGGAWLNEHTSKRPPTHRLPRCCKPHCLHSITFDAKIYTYVSGLGFFLLSPIQPPCFPSSFASVSVPCVLL